MSPLPSAKPLEGEVSARLEAAVTIDCSGDGDVAARGGVA